MRDDEIEAMLAVNVKGSIVLVRECVRQILVRPTQEAPSASEGVGPGNSAHPSVTIISSVVAARGSPRLSVYAATKAALEGFGLFLPGTLAPAESASKRLHRGFWRPTSQPPCRRKTGDGSHAERLLAVSALPPTLSIPPCSSQSVQAASSRARSSRVP
jgi:hypothetical protein